MSAIVLVEMQVKPDAINEMKSLLKKILPDTRVYDGCKSVNIYGNLDDSGNLVFYERWDSKKQYDSYLTWRTETGVLAQLGAMLESPPSIRHFEKIDV
jgi:quinol monooxygenase YgiN